jgi:hypothetical protein
MSARTAESKGFLERSSPGCVAQSGERHPASSGMAREEVGPTRPGATPFSFAACHGWPVRATASKIHYTDLRLEADGCGTKNSGSWARSCDDASLMARNVGAARLSAWGCGGLHPNPRGRHHFRLMSPRFFWERPKRAEVRNGRGSDHGFFCSRKPVLSRPGRPGNTVPPDGTSRAARRRRPPGPSGPPPPAPRPASPGPPPAARQRLAVGPAGPLAAQIIGRPIPAGRSARESPSRDSTYLTATPPARPASPSDRPSAPDPGGQCDFTDWRPLPAEPFAPP